MSGYSPTDICNQALDAAAVEFTLGDLQEGTKAAQVCLRAYGECVRQLLRSAPWTFARKEAPLLLLADATGITPNVGNRVPSGFMYSYQYPIDCARVRYIPWCPFQNPGVPPSNIVPTDPNAPIMTGLGQPPFVGQPIRPARFLITSDPNYPAPLGTEIDAVQGQSPAGSTVILCNVQSARCVYTWNAMYPQLWDHLFRAALVAYLASEIVVPLSKDKKFGVAQRDHQILIAKDRIKEARAMDGDEGWHSSDLSVDWMNFRRAERGAGAYGGPGGMIYGGGDGGGFGCWGGGWGGSLTFGNGSAY